MQLLFAVLLVLGLIQLWQASLLQGQQLLNSQTENMARMLVKQTVYGATPAIQLQEDEQLQWLTNTVTRDPTVISATIYDAQGVRLAFSTSITDLDLAPDSAEMSSLLTAYPPYVESIKIKNENVGFVELRLDLNIFFQEIKTAHEMNMQQQQVMLLVAGLIGILLSRALSFKRAAFDRRNTAEKVNQKK